MQRTEVAELMEQALALAAPTRPHPNPRVGAILLDAAGRIVARASHEGPGREHAEAAVLAAAGGSARGGTLVVTLEPCTHHGRTPPCVEAIVAGGVAAVFVGAVDPDSRVSGSGVRALRAAGVAVTVGVAEVAVVAADPGYFHHRTTGYPLLTLKTAATLDGQVAAADGTSRWITSPEAREDAHRLRAAADAVLVGAGTVRADDPRLTARLAAYDGPQPVPVVVAGHRPIDPGAAVFAGKALVYSPVPRDLPAEVVVMAGEHGVDLTGMRLDMAERGLLEVLLEGGSRLAGALWRAGAVGRGVAYVAGKVAGGQGLPPLAGPFPTIDAASPVRIERVTRLGNDVRIDYRVGN